MTTFQTMIIIFFSIVIIILIFRFLTNGKFHFTSQYNEQKKYKIEENLIRNKILEALKNSNFKRIKSYQNEFSAITLPTIWSFSEKVIVKVEKIDESNSLIIFSSKCLFPLQIFDWGKNQRNSSRFFINMKA